MNMDSIKVHNELIDSRMIANELSKFKMEIRKMGSRESGLMRKLRDSSDLYESDSEETKLLKALRENQDSSFAYLDETNNKVVIETSPSHFDNCCEEELISSRSSTSISADSLEKIDFIRVSALPKSITADVDYFEINEDNSKFNVDEEEEQHIEKEEYDPMCFMCCNEDQCEFSKSYDSQSFYSLPNFSDYDVENLMKISKFQSLIAIESLDSMTSEKGKIKPQINDDTADDGVGGRKFFDKKLEREETEQMLMIKRLEIEEKDLQDLIIMSNTYSKSRNYEATTPSEGERIISDLLMENQGPMPPHFNSMERKILRKCFKEWLQKTTLSKILKTNAFSNEDRVKKINDFLNKIRLEQNKVVSRKVKPKATHGNDSTGSHSKTNNTTLRKDFEHRLKSQQNIIELQKLKIKRQEQLITEMKLAKFTEMVKESKNDLKMELLNAKRGNSKLKAKVRCIQMISNIPLDPLEEERRKLIAQGLIVPKFLAKMQERAEERHNRHEEARERRNRLELDKEEAKKAAEIAKRLEDEEAKRKRLTEMREKRRHEKMLKELKEQERLQYQKNLKIARDHYQHKLLKRLGFLAFELLIRLKRANYKKSLMHRQRTSMKRCFKVWHKNAQVVWNHRRALADKVYNRNLTRKFIKVWLHINSINHSKLLVAIDWHEVKLSQKIFDLWLNYSECCKVIEKRKIAEAEAHFSW